LIFGIFDFGATVTGTVGLAGSRSIATGILVGSGSDSIITGILVGSGSYSISIVTGIFLVVVCELEEPLDDEEPDEDEDEEQDDSESVEQLRGRIQCFFTCPSHLQPLLRERDLERERLVWRW